MAQAEAARPSDLIDPDHRPLTSGTEGVQIYRFAGGLQAV
jgi:hypothetical protein